MFPHYTGDNSIVCHFQLKHAAIVKSHAKVCRREMAGITLLSVHVHDESYLANFVKIISPIFMINVTPLILKLSISHFRW